MGSKINKQHRHCEESRRSLGEGGRQSNPYIFALRQNLAFNFSGLPRPLRYALGPRNDWICA
jgi:hypothetical protein